MDYFDFLNLLGFGRNFTNLHYISGYIREIKFMVFGAVYLNSIYQLSSFPRVLIVIVVSTVPVAAPL